MINTYVYVYKMIKNLENTVHFEFANTFDLLLNSRIIKK